MKPLHIVEEKVFGQAFAGLGDRLVVMEIDLLVFDCPPQPLYKNTPDQDGQLPGSSEDTDTSYEPDQKG